MEDRIFAYHDNPAHVEAMRGGKVDCAASSPPFSFDLEKIGCTLLLSTKQLFPEGRPERVIATQGTFAEQKRDDLKRFLRAILRAFWFERDPDNFRYLVDMERRLRAISPNGDERDLRKVTSPTRFEGRSLPVDGRVPLEGLRQIAEEMKRTGEIGSNFSVASVLKDDVVKEAFRGLLSRKELEAQWQRVSEIMANWGH